MVLRNTSIEQARQRVVVLHSCGLSLHQVQVTEQHPQSSKELWLGKPKWIKTDSDTGSAQKVKGVDKGSKL